MCSDFHLKTLTSIIIIVTGVCVAQDDSIEALDFPILTDPMSRPDR